MIRDDIHSYIYILIGYYDVDLEWFLVENGVITDSELEEDPRLAEKVTVKKAIGSSRYREYNSSDEDSN